ncbi:MAG: S8 family serine peptidase [Muribaculaceae bacterium]|nr:S8 family serine peptidase [Muribaculaceae bacterium]
MKRFLLATIAFLTLAIGFAQLSELLPVSVQRFFDERTDQQRLKRMNHADAIPSMAPHQFAPTHIINGVEMVDAFIEIDNKGVLNALQAQGVIINCDLDEFVTAQIPVDMLAKIGDIPGVINVEMSKLVDLCTDTTLSVTHAGQVINGTEYGLPQGYDGTGVVVGIIDAGFDYQHLAFRCADDTSRTRIVRVYDPANETGHPAMSGTNRMPGSIFMGEQIDTLTTDMFDNSHGTHTASIAAGLHVGNYGGMAPSAEIVLCAARDLNVSISETQVVNCMRYIYSYADSVGKPCVVSVSVSTNPGPRDGTDYISRAAARFTGPGHIFVIAAGNTARSTFYTCGPTTSNKQFSTIFGQLPDGLWDYTYFYKHVWYDTWVRDKNIKPLLRFHVLDTKTHHIVWQSKLISSTQKIDVSEISKYYEPDFAADSVSYISISVVKNTYSQKFNLQCAIHNLKSKDYSLNEYGMRVSRYAIGMTVYPPSISNPSQADSCFIDCWIGSGEQQRLNDPIYVDEVTEDGDTISNCAPEGFYSRSNAYSSIGTYAVHDSVISAGAYTGHDSYYSLRYDSIFYDIKCTIGAIYDLSSYQREGYGPTAEALPTITAPGVYVVAAGSRYSYFGNNWHASRVMTVNGHVWGIMTGTSMAAPTVAGIIAQWLQIKPDLTPSETKSIIAQTAIKDDFTQNIDNGFRFGPNGKIDAMAGARYLLHITDDDHDVLLGDVNNDGLINVTDVSSLVNYLLLIPDDENEPVNFEVTINLQNSDYSQDGVISITDLMMLINYLMSLEE